MERASPSYSCSSIIPVSRDPKTIHHFVLSTVSYDILCIFVSESQQKKDRCGSEILHAALYNSMNERNRFAWPSSIYMCFFDGSSNEPSHHADRLIETTCGRPSMAVETLTIFYQIGLSWLTMRPTQNHQLNHLNHTSSWILKVQWERTLVFNSLLNRLLPFLSE